jgi:catalase
VSSDPLLDVRASVYLISGKQRRDAKEGLAVEDVQTEAVKAAT